MKDIAYYNGKTDLIEKLQVPVTDRAVYFGDGVYEVTFTSHHKIFALDEHVDRLFNSCKLIEIVIPYTKEEIKKIITDLSAKVESPEQIIYWQISRGSGYRVHYFTDSPANLWIMIRPSSGIGLFDRDVHLHIVEDTRYLLCNVKTTNLIINCMAAEKAKQEGCFEAIFKKGDIIKEGSHSGWMIIKDGVLKTHPLNNEILPSISRKHLLAICKENGIPVEETPFTLQEMLEADEVMTNSTTALLTRANEVDKVKVGGKNPKIISLLRRKYMEKIFKETGMTKEWPEEKEF